MQTINLTDFELLEVLGTGTVGTVYRAHDKIHDRMVAIKALLPAARDDAKIAARFEREMIILQRLSHPNIIRYYGGGQMGPQWFYAMELIDGGSVKAILSQHGRCSWQQAVEWGIQICSALQHAHNHGIIHRDLKPSNLFLMQDGRLVLGDFGVARDTQSADVTGDGITVGTYAYMPPEQICADQQISNKTDLYALGCVLYEMLTGGPPFTGRNFAEIWDQHLHKPPAPLGPMVPGLPDWLASIVMQLLEKDPQQRPFSARSVEGYLKEHRESSRLEGISVEIPGGGLSLAQHQLPATDVAATQDVSWATLGGLLVAITGLVCVAWLFQR